MTVLLRSRRPVGHLLVMRRRLLVLLLVAAVLGALAPPADAATSRAAARARRSAVRAKKARLASQLNLLKASERQLVAAASVLGAQADAVAMQVRAARQATAVAQAELRRTSEQLETTRVRIQQLSGLVVARAVARFMAPVRAGRADPAATADLATSARKQALLDSVAASDRDVIDQLRMAREDNEIARAAADAAAQRARARARQTELTLAALRRATADKRRVAASVQARKQEVLSEIEAQAAAEASLSRIINQRTRFGPDSFVSSRGCLWPTRGRTTSEFGYRWGRLHAGVDIGARTGTAIWSAKAGNVIFTGRQSGYGNVVIVDHGGGLTTLYAHQSRIKAYEGQRVRQGQTIGSVGSTGRSTGPHLHFETRYNGRARNPRTCLR